MIEAVELVADHDWSFLPMGGQKQTKPVGRGPGLPARA
jgi:hypothetical protein